MEGIIKTLLALTMAAAINVSMAKERPLSEMKAKAREALHECGFYSRMKANDARELLVLDKRKGIVVLGYENGGFAVIAEDDNFDGVLGVSETPYNPNTTNANFLWWLNAVEQMTASNLLGPLPVIKPDTCKFPEAVAPLMKTKWGQSAPYCDMCPKTCPTGCVATATAQVLKYFQWPKSGIGYAFVYKPFGDFEGTKYEASLEDVEYDYDNMLDSYGTIIRVSQEKKDAVATLMSHVGLAMKAQYENGGTGSYNETLCHGLRNNLRYPFAVTVNRDMYTAREWMEKIFEMISKNIPLVYGGSDNTYTGHEFVLHGYNKSGKIYINWGWEGGEDGYYDLSQLILYWGAYDFSMYQDMVLRCSPDYLYAEKVEVDVTQPGTLDELLAPEQMDTIKWLKVNGKINSTDLLTIRCMAGAGQNGQGIWGNLSILDLSNAEITAGGVPYLIEDSIEYVTEENVLPYKAFANCSFLIDVALPENLLRYEDGVFAECNNLDNVTISAGENALFVADSNFVMTKDRKEIIEWLPNGSDILHIVIPENVVTVHDYAFAGRYLYERITIPESVKKIGKCAFNRCFDLSRTYVLSPTPPEIDVTAIDPLDITLRYLYVPQGSKSDYLNASGWNLYGNKRIKEFEYDGIEWGLTDRKNIHHDSNRVYDIYGKYVGDRIPDKAGIYVGNGKKFLVK